MKKRSAACRLAATDILSYSSGSYLKGIQWNEAFCDWILCLEGCSVASMGFESLIDYNKTAQKCSFVKASKQVFECGKLNARSASEKTDLAKHQKYRSVQYIAGHKVVPASFFEARDGRKKQQR